MASRVDDERRLAALQTQIRAYKRGAQSSLTEAPRSFGVGSNYAEFEADGTLALRGTATYWRDLDFPILICTTGPSVPSLTPIQGNIQAPQWQVNDYNQCEGQELVHEWKEGSKIQWHAHILTNGLDATNRYLRLEVEWVWANATGVLSSTITSTSSDLLIPANTPSKTMFVFEIAQATLTGGKIGGRIWPRLKRVASVGAAPSNDPWITMLQAHIECDTLGSRSMTTK